MNDYERMQELHVGEVARLGELAPRLVKTEHALEVVERSPAAELRLTEFIAPERWKKAATNQIAALRKEGEALERSILERCEKYPELAPPFSEQTEQLRIVRARCTRYALEYGRLEALVKHQPESSATPMRAQRAAELRETVRQYRTLIRRLEPWEDEAHA